jgi:hypothetical protein
MLEVLKEGEAEVLHESIEAISPSLEPKPKVRHRRKMLSVDQTS